MSQLSRSRGKRLGGPPLRIAFLVDWLEDPYQSTLLAGAAAEAQRRGVTLLALPGGILGGKTRNGVTRNYVYDLVRPSHFDGVIVLSGTLGNQLGATAVSEMIAAFGDLPIVSIALPLAGHSSVLVDNKSGMRRAIEHLVVDHAYRKIAFIRGPEVNAEAEARFNAYVEVLDEHGIALDGDLVLSGDFQREGGSQAVRTLLDERRVPAASIDAIAGATDLMVMGAIEELERRGLRVPHDVAAVGFDDLEESRYLSPPLTSVRQPLAEQGAEALRHLLGRISGVESAPLRVLETRFVRRRSCGCLPQESVLGALRETPKSRLSVGAELIRVREVALAEMTRAARGSFVGAERGWEERLFNALAEEFASEERAAGDPFRTALDRLLVQVLEAGGDVAIGHDLVSALRRQLWLAAGEDAGKGRRIEDLLHDARVLISTLVERSQARARLKAQAWARLLGDVSAQLAGVSDHADLGQRIAVQMPRLGLDLCLVLEAAGDAAADVTLRIAWASDRQVSLAEIGDVYPARDLFPRTFDRDLPRTFVVLPLARPGEAYGYAVVSYVDIDGYAFEMLRELLTAGALSARRARPNRPG